MKAIVLTAYGAIDQLELRDVPAPSYGPKQIGVRMAGASINPVDWKLRSGALQAFMPLVLPAILGRDASGEVIEVGADVTAFEVGDRVLGLVTGGYAEIVVAGAEAWAKLPPALDLVDAGALPLVLLTGAQLVEEGVQPRKGDVVLITGALGSVGRAAVFAAKALGAHVWAGVRRSQKLEAEKLGADAVVALDDADEVDRSPRFDGVADTVGGDAIAKLVDRVKRGGTIASVVGEPAGANERGLTVRAITTHADAKRLATLAQAVADGDLVIPIAHRLPLAEAAKAQRLAENHARGKVLLMGRV